MNSQPRNLAISRTPVGPELPVTCSFSSQASTCRPLACFHHLPGKWCASKGAFWSIHNCCICPSEVQSVRLPKRRGLCPISLLLPRYSNWQRPTHDSTQTIWDLEARLRHLLCGKALQWTNQQPASAAVPPQGQGVHTTARRWMDTKNLKAVC